MRCLTIVTATGSASSWKADRDYKIRAFSASGFLVLSFDPDMTATDISGAANGAYDAIIYAANAGMVAGLNMPIKRGQVVYLAAAAARQLTLWLE